MDCFHCSSSTLKCKLVLALSFDMSKLLNSGSQVLRKLYTNPALLASNLDSFRQQETIFVVINLVLLVLLLAMHAALDSFWGSPSRLLVATLSGSLVLRALQ